MKRDETVISKILSDVIDGQKSPKEGELPLTASLDRLVKYVDQERAQALGWAYAEACVHLDSNTDTRKVLVPDFCARAYSDLDLVPTREEYQ